MAVAPLMLVLQVVAPRGDTATRADTARAPDVVARVTTRAPRIDGRLDEAEWRDAPVVDAFWQRNPAQGEPATERTEVRILVDAQALYVGARLHERDATQVRAVRTRRDTPSPSDRFSIVLDSEHDHQSAARFTVNPDGVRSDALLAGDAAEGDASWDPAWEAATTRDAAGWTVEMRIPLTQLRFRTRAGGPWGVNFERHLVSRQEEDSYVPLPRTTPGYVSRFAHLVGVGGLAARRALEVTPYGSTQLDTHPPLAGDPRAAAGARARAGLDLRWSATPGVTLAATVNPDFGQVEADPATLNLSAFEILFAERRPFFLDGAPVFEFGGTGATTGGDTRFFYSRRIGGAPALNPDVAVATGGVTDTVRTPFVESPTSTEILGAVKLIGRLGASASFGVLHAETGREYARLIPGAGGRAAPVARQLVEPRAHHSVARLRRDARGGWTSVGLIATSTLRDLETARVDSAFVRRAQVAGLDWRHRWGDGRFQLDGWLAGSALGGSAPSLAAVQRSPVRYLQRPDRGGARLDTTRTTLTGGAGEVRLGYAGRAGLLLGATARATAPTFELNDLGYLTSADERSLVTTIGWQQPAPTARVQSWGVDAYDARTATWDGTALGHAVGATGYAYAQAGWGGTATVEHARRGLSRTAARGGPLVGTGAATTVSWSALSDPRRALGVSAYGRHGGDAYGGRTAELGASATLRPSPGVQLALGPALTRTREAAAYVATIDDPLAAATYGQRHVFARLDARTVGVAARADVAFHPDLSLQLYLQPFGAVARYGSPGELRAPRRFAFLRYGGEGGSTVARDATGAYVIDPDGGRPAAPFTIGDPDLAYRTVNGTAVLRWEYRPGAVLYAVWTQRRTSGARASGFDAGDLRAAFGVAPENVLLLKASVRWVR